MVSLFDGNRPGRRVIEIDVLSKGKVKVAVNGVDQEDGSGESWLFRGYLYATNVHCKVHGYLSTQNRRGWVQFQPESPEAVDYVVSLR